MNPPIVSIPVDLLTIARCLVAVVWGIVWALTIQHTKWGQFLAEHRAWIAVTIGVGVDLAIIFHGDFTPLLVFACSSIGIIARSLNNEANDNAQVSNSYNLTQGLENSIALCGNAVELLEGALDQPDTNHMGRGILQATKKLNEALEVVRKARHSQLECRRKAAQK